MRRSTLKAHVEGEEVDMDLVDMAGVVPMALGGVVPTDPAEEATDLAEVGRAMEGEESQWAQWQPEQALA